MGLPRAVQEAADAADALVAEMGGPQPGSTGPETPEATTAQAPEVVSPQSTQQPEVTPATPSAEPAREVDWEQKYKSLKGMFDAEVPRLHAQNRELREQFDTFKADQLARQTPPQPKQLITDQDREQFGPDLVGLIERGVTEKLQPLQHTIDRLQAENQQLRSQVGNVQQSQGQTAEQLFYAALERAVPEVKELNFDQGFLDWLQEVDVIYGIPRKMALDNAANRKDVQRAAAIFNAYKASKAPAQTQQTSQKNELARQVTPARSRSVAPPQSEQKLLWTQASINAFYTDLRKGHIAPEEAARLEADLLAAAAEGRVQG